MKQRSVLKKAFGMVIAIAILTLNFSPRVQSIRSLPSTIYLGEGQTQSFDFLFPLKTKIEGDSVNVVRGNDQTLSDVGATIQSNSIGNSNITFSLLGIIPIKEVEVQVAPQKRLIPGGQVIGVAMMTEGVFVAGSQSIVNKDGVEVNPARDAGIFPGDSILSIGETQIMNFDQIKDLIANSNGKELTFRIKRDGKESNVQVKPAKDQSGVYRLGVWIRDSTAGIGTMTFIDPEKNTFAALGHAITDSDTGRLLTVRDGGVFQASVVGIEKGQQGKPGELRGIFSLDTQTLCSISNNTDFGIYGNTLVPIENPLYPDGLPIGGQNIVHEGPAKILSTLDDQGVKAYDCRIIKVTRQNVPATRSLVIEVTDPELLRRTGGIVQGMSGSPIVQDGYLVGAVTHVYVNDPTRGYGLFIEWMLATQNQ